MREEKADQKRNEEENAESRECKVKGTTNVSRT